MNFDGAQAAYNSVAGSGLTADAPAANATIASVTVPSTGMYEITAWCEQVGTPIPLERANTELRVTGTTVCALVAGSGVPVTVNRQMSAVDTVTVRTKTVVTAAGTRYAGHVSIKRVA